jgi:hypothetical protein
MSHIRILIPILAFAGTLVVVFGLMIIGEVSAQTTTTTTPGTPATGSGGSAPLNMLILFTTALLTVIGIKYMLKLSAEKTKKE